MDYNAAERHEMVIARKHSDEVVELYCPTCGRRMLMQWPPKYKKIVLEPGDEFAEHTGSYFEEDGKSQDLLDQLEEPAADDPYLAPFEEWLQSQDFGR